MVISPHISENLKIELSVVIPIHNEEKSLPHLLSRLCQLLQNRFGEAWQVVVVDDCSTDRSREIASAIASKWPNITFLSQPRRRGQSAALLDGFRVTIGRYVATIDGDGQLIPDDILVLFDALEPDWDAVMGIRRKHTAGALKRLFSHLANSLRCKLMNSNFHDTGCSLRVFRRELLMDLIPINGVHRFMCSFFEIAGRRILAMEVNELPRQYGRSHYGILDRLPGALIDCIFLWWLKRRSDALDRSSKSVSKTCRITSALNAEFRTNVK